MFDDICDLYNDAHGFRPSEAWMRNFNFCEYNEQKKIACNLRGCVDEKIEAAAFAGRTAVAKYHDSITKLMGDHDISLAVARARAFHAVTGMPLKFADMHDIEAYFYDIGIDCELGHGLDQALLKSIVEL
jgi:hypothetical protein